MFNSFCRVNPVFCLVKSDRSRDLHTCCLEAIANGTLLRYLAAPLLSSCCGTCASSPRNESRKLGTLMIALVLVVSREADPPLPPPSVNSPLLSNRSSLAIKEGMVLRVLSEHHLSQQVAVLLPSSLTFSRPRKQCLRLLTRDIMAVELGGGPADGSWSTPPPHSSQLIPGGV